jgi:hypothetical protein
MRFSIRFSYICLAILFIPVSFSHGPQPEQKEILLPLDSLSAIYIAGSFALLVLIISLLTHRHFEENHKRLAFLLIAIPVVLASLYIVASTIYLNAISVTQGPVHWHADYKVIVCNETLELVDPGFLSNYVGRPDLHEHNDNRIHVEGRVMKFEDVELRSYFEAVGGKLSDDEISYMTKDGLITKKNGQKCPNGKEGNLKIFVNGKRIENGPEYVIYPSPLVPPGDCIIIVFDESNANSTEIMCESWEAKNWNYATFKRPKVEVGGRIWH